MTIDNRIYDSVTTTVKVVLRQKGCWYLSADDIEEIAQDAMVHIWLNVEKFDPEKGVSFKTWANTAAHNWAISQSKKLHTIAKSSARLDDLREFDVLDDFEYDFDHIDLEEIRDHKRYQMLRGFVDTMNSKEQKMIQMMEDGFSKEEMAEGFQTSGGNIDTMKSRVRSKVKKYLEESKYYRMTA